MDQPSGDLMRLPEEMLEKCCTNGVKKAGMNFGQTWWTAVGAGAFIALAAFGSLQVSALGLGKVWSGVVFATGLLAVVILGLQLFTGNILIVTAAWSRQLAWPDVYKNWFLVYLGNLAGAVLVAALISGAAPTVAWQQCLAECVQSKLTQTFLQALARGILCNVLVSGAVMLTYASPGVSGKVLLIVFPIVLFIVSGYEHVVANFFYFSAGVMLEGGEIHWLAIGKSLMMVTAGNVGGGLLVSGLMVISGRGAGKS